MLQRPVQHNHFHSTDHSFIQSHANTVTFNWSFAHTCILQSLPQAHTVRPLQRKAPNTWRKEGGGTQSTTGWNVCVTHRCWSDSTRRHIWSPICCWCSPQPHLLTPGCPASHALKTIINYCRQSLITETVISHSRHSSVTQPSVTADTRQLCSHQSQQTIVSYAVISYSRQCQSQQTIISYSIQSSVTAIISYCSHQSQQLSVTADISHSNYQLLQSSVIAIISYCSHQSQQTIISHSRQSPIIADSHESLKTINHCRQESVVQSKSTRSRKPKLSTIELSTVPPWDISGVRFCAESTIVLRMRL